MSTSSFGIRGRVIEPDAPGRPADPIPRNRARADSPHAGRWIAWSLAVLLAMIAMWQLSSAGWIHAKAVVAQHLIAASWQLARAEGQAPHPWPWADTRPVARLTVPGRGVDLYVLEGASARSLAFGPGHVSGTASPGATGNIVIVAHRDTHFAFLRDLSGGEAIALEDAHGNVSRFRVREISIVDRGDTRVLDPSDSPQLTLITCYPFDAVAPGTPLRYVVVAEREAQARPDALRARRG